MRSSIAGLARPVRMETRFFLVDSIVFAIRSSQSRVISITSSEVRWSFVGRNALFGMFMNAIVGICR